uniref:Uncharacterized protein n=1 Tax=viral metagenome TaxID=1070528 RepID=A0A6C0CJ79_9ZZZZ
MRKLKGVKIYRSPNTLDTRVYKTVLSMVNVHLNTYRYTNLMIILDTNYLFKHNTLTDFHLAHLAKYIGATVIDKFQCGDVNFYS